MKKILITLAFACCLYTVQAQGIFKKEANWQDKKNGITYEMNIWAKSAKDETLTKALAKFTPTDEKSLLEKVELIQEGKLKFSVPLRSETTEIQLEPGLYTFKLYHKKLGIKEFEIELKKGQKTNIQLTAK
ncbi:hypothetical protein ACJVDH_05280 [Pedobacter sp. AW1-32]|uniref:hypothetical protein n=1 Tax=Pedobacter sp. AW1-32 TaxID=3383026 RepID=UPI003FF04376